MSDTPAPAPAPTAPAKPKRRRPRWQRWLIDLGLVIGVLVVAQLWHRRNLTPADGRPAPQVILHTLEGKPVTLADYRGKSVQLHFWATWCSVCKVEYGALNSLHDSLDDDQALLAIVADGKDPAMVQRYAKEHGLRYEILLGNREALEAFGVSSFPTNFWVTPDGTLTGQDVGMSTRWGMRARMSCAGP